MLDPLSDKEVCQRNNSKSDNLCESSHSSLSCSSTSGKITKQETAVSSSNSTKTEDFTQLEPTANTENKVTRLSNSNVSNVKTSRRRQIFPPDYLGKKQYFQDLKITKQETAVSSSNSTKTEDFTQLEPTASTENKAARLSNSDISNVKTSRRRQIFPPDYFGKRQYFQESVVTKKNKSSAKKKVLKSFTSTSPPQAKLNYKLRSSQFNTSYWNRKKSLNKQGSPRRGRPRKNFNTVPTNENHSSETQDNAGNIESPCGSTVKNQRTHWKTKKKIKEIEKVSNVIDEANKQKPVLVEGVKRKRGRPRLIKEIVVPQKEEKIVEEDIMKKKEETVEKNVMKKKEETVKENVTKKNEEIITENVMKEKEDIVNETLKQNKEKLVKENIMQKEEMVKENIMQKEEMVKENIMQKKEKIVNENIMQKKKTLVKENIIQKKEKVVKENIIQKKEKVVKENIIQKKEKVVKEKAIQKKEEIVQEDILEKRDGTVQEDVLEKRNETVQEDVLEKRDETAQDNRLEKNDGTVQEAVLMKENEEMPLVRKEVSTRKKGKKPQISESEWFFGRPKPHRSQKELMAIYARELEKMERAKVGRAETECAETECAEIEHAKIEHAKRERAKTERAKAERAKMKRAKKEREKMEQARAEQARTFVQHLNCLNENMKIPKCRECRQAAYNRSTWDMVNSYCRFLEYRKLFLASDGSILCAGFLQPSDSTDSDKNLWLPNVDHPPQDLSINTAKELLIKIGDQFCDLVLQEKEALSLNLGPDKSMTWKKLVQGVREMCDVCDTTLFNIHWVCHKCGFAVCIDCYKVRKQSVMVDDENQLKGRDDYLWLFCHNRVPHEQDQLMMAQMIPGDALWTMNDTMHKVRGKWGITAYCRCISERGNYRTENCVNTGICKQLMSSVSNSFANINKNTRFVPPLLNVDFNVELPEEALKWLNGPQWEEVDNENNRRPMRSSVVNRANNSFIEEEVCHNTNCILESTPAVSEYVTEVRNQTWGIISENSLTHFNQRYPQKRGGREPLPLRIFTTLESNLPFEDVPHSWLCNGRLLLLHEPDHQGNLELFQEPWKRGQPVMVAGVDGKLNMSLWHPNGFCRDFGDVVNDLVNCRTGAIIQNLPMKKFWLGFENFNERMKDDAGEYMLLKLKDWPPGEDFSEKLPLRFQDLMKGLPLPEYTHRDGIFNLAGRLPSWFVRPDLGPKMYNAYGSALYPTKGTTNLHLDMSDAVNVMVYVGIPRNGQDELHIVEALKAVDEGGCDSLTRERVRMEGVKPGALWHIYDSRSVDKIRAFLTKVATERGEKLEAHTDPIHDQRWYLNAELRRRLYEEYSVQGYAIAQCLGDAVFIPAGAPHQVRNLHSCVKVAEDFVSPENIAHCFKLTQEFRHLSYTHTNHEDKLQIKNVIYHVVKDALSYLM